MLICCWNFHIDTELARTFVEIVSRGSFIRTAERLNVGQTTVGARIRPRATARTAAFRSQQKRRNFNSSRGAVSSLRADVRSTVAAYVPPCGRERGHSMAAAARLGRMVTPCCWEDRCEAKVVSRVTPESQCYLWTLRVFVTSLGSLRAVAIAGFKNSYFGRPHA